MKILLHVCCAPCLIYPFKRLSEQGFDTEGFFYNPNIHPPEEYSRRLEAVKLLSGDARIGMAYADYAPDEFARAIGVNVQAPGRCKECWGLRMRRTAAYARDNGFDAFSSTLLVSPYQDQEALKGIGEAAARETGVKFYYEDFRPGFRQAHEQARKMGLYCQKYCGCSYSLLERNDRKKK